MPQEVFVWSNATCGALFSIAGVCQEPQLQKSNTANKHKNIQHFDYLFYNIVIFA